MTANGVFRPAPVRVPLTLADADIGSTPSRFSPACPPGSLTTAVLRPGQRLNRQGIPASALLNRPTSMPASVCAPCTLHLHAAGLPPSQRSWRTIRAGAHLKIDFGCSGKARGTIQVRSLRTGVRLATQHEQPSSGLKQVRLSPPIILTKVSEQTWVLRIVAVRVPTRTPSKGRQNRRDSNHAGGFVPRRNRPIAPMSVWMGGPPRSCDVRGHRLQLLFLFFSSCSVTSVAYACCCSAAIRR